jgi:hypothetical protein
MYGKIFKSAFEAEKYEVFQYVHDNIGTIPPYLSRVLKLFPFH